MHRRSVVAAQWPAVNGYQLMIVGSISAREDNDFYFLSLARKQSATSNSMLYKIIAKYINILFVFFFLLF